MIEVFTARYVDLPAHLTDEEYELFSEFATNEWTWGDTSMVLVHKQEFEQFVYKMRDNGGSEDLFELSAKLGAVLLVCPVDAYIKINEG